MGGLWIPKVGNFDVFPDNQLIGASTTQEICQEKTIKFDSCLNNFIPGAYLNVVGSVTANLPQGRSFKRYKACFSHTQLKQVDINAQDTAPAESPVAAPAEPCVEETPDARKLLPGEPRLPKTVKTALPKTTKTKSPTVKKCKGTAKSPSAPSKGGPKAPSTPSKGTRRSRTLRRRM